MYTLDLSGHDSAGKAGITRFGGLFVSLTDAVAHGRAEVANGRFAFDPKVLWVRDESGDVVARHDVSIDDGV